MSQIKCYSTIRNITNQLILILPYMSILFGNILGSILGGFLLSLLLISFCYLTPKKLYAHPRHSVGSIIVLVIAFFFFLFESTLLVGGFKAKRYAGQAKAIIESLPIENQKNRLSAKDRRQINWYIARRFGWLIGGLIVTGGAVCRLCTEPKQRSSTGSRGHYSSHHPSNRYYKQH